MKHLTAMLLLAAACVAPAHAQDPGAPPPVQSGIDYGSESWTYVKPGADLGQFKSVLIGPTTYYQGEGAQYDGLGPADLQIYADMITGALNTTFTQSFHVVQRDEPRTLAVQVTILGAKKTQDGLATASHVLPFGLALNAFKSIQGKQGSFTGSLLVKVEFTDARTGDLIAAAVRRRAPDALNVGATLSMTDTVKAIAAELAQTLRDKMIEANMPSTPA
jgi:hypothetical protein